MNKLYITGGRQRKKLLKADEEWTLFEKAVVLCVDLGTAKATMAVEYQTPPEACADDDPSILFKSGTITADRLYVVTSTEVLIYRLPGFDRVGYVSIPCFNDLHHVLPTPEGNLAVVSTGLDLVVETALDGTVLREWDVLGENTWKRFSRQTDYRKVPTTKPHKSHPNFVFYIGPDLWVTRADQRDAVCLTRPGPRVAVDVEKPHDGVLYHDRIYFTTVDGKIVIASARTLQVEEVVDLALIGSEDRMLLGWCRGLLVVDEQRVWVGFTRIRKTKFLENILWVKHAFREMERPTHIALYDLRSKKLLQEIDLESQGMNVIFSIFPASS